MADLSKIPTAELRAELDRREDAERAAYKEAVDAKYPCPYCRAGVRTLETTLTREHRTAPRAADGTPLLFAPFEQGDMVAADYSTTVVCENGHQWQAPTEYVVFDEPIPGLQ
jgi:hypothetical protein